MSQTQRKLKSFQRKYWIRTACHLSNGVGGFVKQAYHPAISFHSEQYEVGVAAMGSGEVKNYGVILWGYKEFLDP